MMTDTERQAWLEERKTGIGASDSPAIVGLDPWKTALHVYLGKVGQLPDAGLDGNEAVIWGNILEPIVAQEVTRRYGIEYERPESRILRHPESPWMLASLDFRRRGDDRRPLQVKTCSAFKAKDWGEEDGDDLPEHVLVQVTHEMLVVGADCCDVAVLIGGQRLKFYEGIRYDSDLGDTLIQAEREFWAKVEARVPPEPDFDHPSTSSLLKQLQGFADRPVIKCDDDGLNQLAVAFDRVRRERLTLEKEQQVLENQLRHGALSRGAGVLEFPTGWSIECGSVTQNRKAQPARTITFPTLRVKEARRA